jgi:hypothetical protein
MSGKASRSTSLLLGHLALVGEATLIRFDCISLNVRPLGRRVSISRSYQADAEKQMRSPDESLRARDARTNVQWCPGRARSVIGCGCAMLATRSIIGCN